MKKIPIILSCTRHSKRSSVISRLVSPQIFLYAMVLNSQKQLLFVLSSLSLRLPWV